MLALGVKIVGISLLKSDYKVLIANDNSSPFPRLSSLLYILISSAACCSLGCSRRCSWERTFLGPRSKQTSHCRHRHNAVDRTIMQGAGVSYATLAIMPWITACCKEGAWVG